MKAIFGSMALALLLSFITHEKPVAAQTLNLKAGDFQSLQHVLSKDGIVHWMREVERRTGNKIKFTHFPSEQAAKARGILDAVKSGVLDVGFAGPLYNTERLPLNSVVGLPGLGNSAVEGSRVLHRMTKDGLLKDEFTSEGVYPVFSVILPPYQILLKSKKVGMPRDWAGLKVRTGGTTQALTARALGAVGVSMPGPEVYTAVERGTVDGILFPLSSVPGYNLQEVVKYISTNASLGGFGMTLVINKALFEKLPADVRQAMLAAGDATAIHLAKAQDESIAQLLTDWEKAGITVFDFSKEELKAMDDAMGLVNEEWVTRVSKQNPNAKAVLEQYQKVLASQ